MSCNSCSCSAEAVGNAADHAPHSASRKLRGVLLAISGVCALSAEILAWTTGENSTAVIILALPSIACAGQNTFRHAWEAVRTFTLGISFLMTLAVIGALAIGHWPEAAMVLFLFEVAERIEEATLAHAKNSIRNLMQLAPDVAHVQGDDGQWYETPTNEVPLSARVLVRPGERVPLDGAVVVGASAVNQAPITGESMPVEKTVGDKIFAGSINGSGALEISVTHTASESTLAHIVRLVEQAQQQKAQAERWVDKFARFYTPAVVIGAIAVAALPPLLFAQPFLPWFSRALVLLVIACPCALVISTPVTIWSGLAAAARRGILIKGGAVLERGRDLKMIAFDKTGTLTQGKPQVTDIVPLNGLNETDVLHLSASLEAQSEHPLADAVVEKWKDGNGQQPLLSVTNFQALAGRGAQGDVQGQEYFIGNHRLTHEREVCGDHVERHLSRLEGEGKSTLIFGNDEESLGVFGVADTLRPETSAAVTALRNYGVRVALLTGDNMSAASRIGTSAGIADVRAELLPQDKLHILDELRKEYSCVGMVGDGINDAPALAKADIGFVMGAIGSDAALEVADVALMNDDLRKIPAFIRLSQTTARVLWQNVVVAIAIKALFLALAVSGYATLWMAVFADVGATLLVVFNSLRLLKCKL
jgi:Cd2+/Zn2+-exporting ATPase